MSNTFCGIFMQEIHIGQCLISGKIGVKQEILKYDTWYFLFLSYYSDTAIYLYFVILYYNNIKFCRKYLSK